MNLTDLQTELRCVEEKIKTLYTEIEKMKPKTDDEKKSEYDKITKLATKHPLNNKTVNNLSPELKKLFFMGLSFLLQYHGSEIPASLLFLCRLSKGTGNDYDAEQLVKLGMDFDETDMDRLLVDLLPYKYVFLTECFIVVHLLESPEPNMLTVLADWAKAMQCDKEDITVIATVAKCYLTDNFDLLDELTITKNTYCTGVFWDFIPMDWIVNKRVNIEEVYIGFITFNNTRKNAYYMVDIIKKLTTGTVLKKNMVVFGYQTEELKLWKKEKVLHRVKTKEKGILCVFDLEEKNWSYGDKRIRFTFYCISFFDDMKAFQADKLKNFKKEGKYIATVIE